jgi:hypothetical protein
MQLKSLWFQEFLGTPFEWTLETLTLQQLNLIVGKNASGKTRALNVILSLSLMLWSGRKISEGEFRVIFQHLGKTIAYELTTFGGRVVSERLAEDDRVLLDRGSGGYGKIWTEKLERHIEFQTPDNQLAAVSRQDALQHSFLAPLIEWANSTYHFAFSQDLGHRHMVVSVPEAPPADLHDTNLVVPVYRRAKRDYPDIDAAIIADMRQIGYEVNAIGLMPSRLVQIASPSGAVEVLFVQEDDLPSPTEQLSMSTGMFRALSVLLQLNYGYVAKTHGCVLLDDIGEGLDFERSKALIEVIASKTKNSNIQVIMTSNDRFVMNAVPLYNWTVLSRSGNKVSPLNYENSKVKFDEFRFTGLNNFDFFARDFLGTLH